MSSLLKSSLLVSSLSLVSCFSSLIWAETLSPAPTAAASVPVPSPAAKNTDAKTPSTSATAKAAVKKETPIGVVMWTKGGVVKAAQPDQPARVLSRRSEIFAHDTITTDAKATGEIAFTDRGVYSIRADTQFKIDDYKYAKNGPASQDKSVMSLVKGGFRTITGSIGKENPEGYQVNTPVATIGVRGTQYSAYVTAKKGTVFKVDKGKINVANEAGSIEIQKCTDKDVTKCVMFAEVGSANSKPVALAEMPAEFAGEVSISPVSSNDMSSMMGGSSSSGPGGSSSSGGFCIQ